MTYLIITFVIIIILSAFKKEAPEENNHKYKATYGNAEEHLSSWNHGFAVGNKAFTKELSYTNCLVLGPTGSGKSSVIITPALISLARGQSSIIINDVSGELWNHTSAYLVRKGYKILKVDFSDATYSESFNPLMECKSVSDVQKLALIIIQNAIGESKGDSAFWENSSVMLISLFARYLLFHAEPQYRTLQNVQRLIERFTVDGKSIDKLIVRTKDESLLNLYKATLVTGEKTLQGIIATVRTALSLFNDPEVCKVTTSNSINLHELRGSQPVALYVCNPLKDLRYFRPLSALFFQSLFNFTLSRLPKMRERPIFFVLDEFASMKFPDITLTISNIRKYRAGLLLCMQDEMALISRYGQSDAHQIKTNTGIQCYLKGQPLNTCKDLSQVMGRYNYEDDKGNSRVRELMTPDEIRQCNDIILLVNNQPALRLAAKPYYKNMWTSHLALAKPYKLEAKQLTEPPLLPIT